MKKIGIITHYYKSTNFGGNLQAYALCKFLNSHGYNAEQISFPFQPIIKKKNAFDGYGISSMFKLGIKIVKKVFVFTVKKPLINKELKKHDIIRRRALAFEKFNNQSIRHSKSIYNSDDIHSCVQEYSVFITGSDQVWNFAWYNPVYFLDFVPSDKVKISYAASIARDFLTEEQKEIFRNSLKDYRAVSVREKSAEKLIEDIVPIDVQTVLDPTLLLTREDWDEVASECVVLEDYVLCYFLGDNKRERKLAKQFARLHNLKIVTIPHTAGIKLMDKKFGDVRLYDASPEQFISLIKHAKYVFTDSFHAVVFSNVYQKQYFVFNRNRKGEMSARIDDITKLFHQEDRFCATKDKEQLEYIVGLSEIDYTQKNKDFEKSIAESFEFLEKNLKD